MSNFYYTGEALLFLRSTLMVNSPAFVDLGFFLVGVLVMPLFVINRAAFLANHRKPIFLLLLPTLLPMRMLLLL